MLVTRGLKGLLRTKRIEFWECPWDIPNTSEIVFMRQQSFWILSFAIQGSKPDGLLISSDHVSKDNIISLRNYVSVL